MAFSGCGSYCKYTYYYDVYLAIQYVFSKLEGGMTVFKY